MKTITGRLRRSVDDGFTLIEVLVAMIIFGIVAAGSTPLLIAGIKATTVGKVNAQAKNLVQQQIDTMRNLPYHVARSAGPYIDLLDTYYQDASGAGANTRCDSHSVIATVTPASATYRCTITHFSLPKFTSMRIDSQFLDKDRRVVVPVGTYDSQSTSGQDVPPSNYLGTTVTITWSIAGKTTTYSTFTEFANPTSSTPLIVAAVRSAAVAVDSNVIQAGAPQPLHVGAGVFSGDVGLSTAATANASAVGAVATYGSGDAASGQATGLLAGPPDQPSFTTVTGSPATGGPCVAHACFGSTQVDNITGTASSGLPTIASSANPARASLTATPSSDQRGFWMTNVDAGTAQARLVRLGLQTSTSTSAPDLVRSTTAASNNGYTPRCTSTPTTLGNAPFAVGGGYVTTTGTSAHSVISCAQAAGRRVDIMPGSLAPAGIVQVTLDYAGLKCTSAPTGGVVTSNFRAYVSYWNGSAYTTLTVTDSQTTDPLQTSLLARGTGGVRVGTDSTGAAIWLGDFIKSWSSGARTSGGNGVNAQGSLQVVSLTTQPTRDADTTGNSAVNVVVGGLSCLAQDNR